MLQWMGGSRRKITTVSVVQEVNSEEVKNIYLLALFFPRTDAARTLLPKASGKHLSRKSNDPFFLKSFYSWRQKQYFEQKKRQQQQKNFGSDSYAEETNVDCQQQKENRSLDILSLLNLSTAPQVYKSSCPDGSSIPCINDPKVKHQFRNFPPTAIANGVTHVMPTEVHEAGSQFGNQVTALLPMNEVDNHVSNNQKNELGHKMGVMYEPRTSVLDLIGDDPSDRNLEISPANEDHVAFSVNGLGRVGTETPVHSPQQVDRTFSYGCTSPLKHSGWSDMLENRDHALDDLDFEAVRFLKSMMKSFNVPDRRHSLRNSMGIEDWYGNLEANTCAWDNSNHHWRDSSIMKSSGHKDVWEASSSSLNNNYFLGGDYGISWDKRPFEVDDLCDDFTTYENHELSEHNLDQVRLLKKRVIAEAGVRSETLVSPLLFEQRGSEEAYWCSTVLDDPRESSSFQSSGSEESCSSTTGYRFL
ncbi:uncharacterized protein LOC115683891 isoform X1 [Syzygium oleosum]|uniref:uncharacterized protein LOC115683891 isoform X1 n=1 Tax=Syzygium oleosum TaxID=219896 RepID=UPI0024BB98D6|nr:uncharacterized protein LOC115683891 isoform X1 [Syzygium oleosum]